MESKQKVGIYVTTKVQKWGNSLAIRLPSHIAEQLAIHQGSEMEIIVDNQKWTIKT